MIKTDWPGPRHLAWWLERLAEPSFVYVIQAMDGTPIKIGVAKDVYARIAGLQTGNPYRLRLLYVFPGGCELEWQLHQKLADRRLEGEWFEMDGAERLFPWFARLADAMIAAYDGTGKAPSYRQPGFSWKRYKPGRAGRVVVTYTTPEPVPEDEAARRLAAAWMRPRHRGDFYAGDSSVSCTGSIV